MHQRRSSTRYRTGLVLLCGLSRGRVQHVAGVVRCRSRPQGRARHRPGQAGGPARRPRSQSATRAESTRAFALPAWAPFDSAVVRGTRTRTGEPGPGYWQQRTTYRLEAELNQVSKRLNGRGTITYHNNSPDTLPTIYIQAYGNLFAPEAKRNTPVLAVARRDHLHQGGRGRPGARLECAWRGMDGDRDGDGAEPAEAAPPGQQRGARVRLEPAHPARRPAWRAGSRDLRAQLLVSAGRRVRRRERLADRPVPRQRRVLHGLRRTTTWP